MALRGAQRESLERVERGEARTLGSVRILRLRDRNLVAYRGTDLVLSARGEEELRLAREPSRLVRCYRLLRDERRARAGKLTRDDDAGFLEILRLLKLRMTPVEASLVESERSVRS